ncbi:MAG TPA: heme-binding domain-containing protein [Pyrinomonadaceae bacterium]|nr:heme-binding domain-containing protein [Pyrinomonadaceae bacterium]
MLRKLLKIAVVVLLIGFVALQFVRPDFTNPPVAEAETLTASTNVPPNVDQILRRSCYDCHSNETKYPWYSKVSPFNWFLADHISDGRREVNMSIWNTYPKDKKVRKLDDICEQVEKAEMPLPSYLWIHWDAALKKEEGQAICEWAKGESQRLSQ